MSTAHGDPDRARKLATLKQDVWARTLAALPTTIERLVHLASLRDQAMGLYRDPELAAQCGEAEANLALRQIHEELFQAWLTFSLEAQMEELERWLADTAVPDPWLRLDPYPGLIPTAAEGAERELFLSNLDILLQALKFTRSGTPGSGPPKP